MDSDHRGYISPVNVNADDAEESMEIERKMERLMQVIRRDREDEMDREEEMEISDKGSSKTPAAVEEGASKSPVVRHAICSAHASLRLARDSAFRAMGELSVAPPPPAGLCIPGYGRALRPPPPPPPPDGKASYEKWKTEYQLEEARANLAATEFECDCKLHNDLQYELMMSQ
ncbi:hypothetical protein R1sor_018930 [Riccia sorocarpa]|uniref:Uncharacterized protein n=1 Tax=Riccia sorocarpa TaxID=122646 RepID=A0ABD3IB80_9MARC